MITKYELSLVLPVYNEERNLKPLTEEIHEALSGICDYRIIYVNDGSSDDSRRVLDDLARSDKTVTVLHFRENNGQSAAFAAGFQEADTAYVATMDADRQNDPTDLPDMLDELDEYDMVAGYRVNRRDSWLRRFGSSLANNVRNFVTGDQIIDTGCSLKIFRREIIDDIPLFEGMHRFFPTLAQREGYSVTQVPTNHRPRVQGESKYTLSGRLIRTVVDLLAVRWLQNRSLDYEIDSKR